MERTYDSLGKPGIFRNDRFWLAGDHVVDPRIKDVPIVKSLVASSKRAKDNFRMTEYQGMNVSPSWFYVCPVVLLYGLVNHYNSIQLCTRSSAGNVLSQEC